VSAAGCQLPPRVVPPVQMLGADTAWIKYQHGLSQESCQLRMLLTRAYDQCAMKLSAPM